MANFHAENNFAFATNLILLSHKSCMVHLKISNQLLFFLYAPVCQCLMSPFLISGSGECKHFSSVAMSKSRIVKTELCKSLLFGPL